MERIFDKTTKVILFIFIVLTIISFTTMSFALTKKYTKNLKVDYVLDFSKGNATAWCVYKSYEDAKKLNGNLATNYMKRGDQAKITKTYDDCDVLQVDVLGSNNKKKYSGYIYYGSTASKYFKVSAPGKPVETKPETKPETERINKKVPVTGVQFKDTSTLKMKVGDTKTLEATVKPTNATNKNVKFSLVDKNQSSLLSVDAKTGQITAKKAGTVKVRVTTEEGNFHADKKVVIEKKEDNTKISFKNNTETENYESGKQIAFADKLEGANGRTIVWSSSKEEIAKVNKNGVVTINKNKKTGATVITATVKGNEKLTAKCKFVVISTEETLKEVKITIEGKEPKSSQIKVKGTVQLTAEVKITPEDATANKSANKQIRWESTKPEVAKVNTKGLVTGVAKGKTTIKAIAVANEKAVAKFEVEVLEPKLTGIKESASVDVGKTIDLGAKAKTDPEGLKITWTSGDKKIATVDSKGVVTGKGSGEVKITAQVAGGEKKTCTVTVIQRVTSITADKSEYEVVKNKTIVIDYKLNPKDAKSEKVEWSTKNEAIAKVTAVNHKELKVRVQGIKPGTTSLIGKIGNVKVVITIKVLPAVESVTINKKDIIMCEGDEQTLTATVKPDNAANKKVTWSSSDESIVVVNPNTGLIRAKKPGTVKIKATSVEDGKSDVCKVVVEDKVYKTKSGKTYKIAVTKTKLNNVIAEINRKHLAQTYYDKGEGLRGGGGRCYYVANCHKAMLTGKLTNATYNNAYNYVYPNQTRITMNYTVVKHQIDKGNPVIVHVSNTTSSTHWVTIVGYRNNCNSLDDLLILGSYSGHLIEGKNGGEINRGLHSDRIIKY